MKKILKVINIYLVSFNFALRQAINHYKDLKKFEAILNTNNSEKLLKRRSVKEEPYDFQIVLIFPHWFKAEYQEGMYLSTNGNEVYIGVKSWIPVSEIRNVMWEDKDVKESNRI